MAGKGIVVVTGAASGIGLASARRLARDGWGLALVDRDGAALDRAAGEIDGPATVHPLDVADEGEVVRVVDGIAATGPILGLVNSAGIAATTPLGQTEVGAFRRILDVNVIGSFLTARACAPAIAESGGGSIVHIASVSGMRGNMGRTAYGASKGAVIAMTRIMAVELAESGVRVNAISPGPVDTPMVQAMHDEAERALWMTHIPMRRYATPEEIASVVAFLIDGAQSSYVTGQILAVDGGFVAGGTIRPL